MATKLIYKNAEALEPINKLLQEASEGVEDEGRTIDSSSMPGVLGAAVGGGVGAGASFAALYFLGTVGLSAAGITSGLATAGAIVGGGMVAGVGVLAAPVAGLAVGGYALIARRNRKRLVQAKEYLLKQVVAKHDAVLKALKKRVDLSEERVQYLEALNISLRRAISDLEEDLAA
ncbi:MAG TPA: hypothetical protein PLI51_02370 [bacterium]|nr:hypothetical protein [bacterium]HPQ65560.1 hypothetical protein [bacterium]